jgi:hypothetical protein
MVACKIIVALLPIVFCLCPANSLNNISLIFIPLFFFFFYINFTFWESALCFPKDSLCYFNLFAAPGVKGSGVNGVVYAAEPLNACSALANKAVKGPPSPFALVIRGGCTFDKKVKNVQDAGFKAAIVYDNENSGFLVSSNVPCPSHFLFFFL